jgi:hypothetical protein
MPQLALALAIHVQYFLFVFSSSFSLLLLLHLLFCSVLQTVIWSGEWKKEGQGRQASDIK